MSSKTGLISNITHRNFGPVMSTEIRSEDAHDSPNSKFSRTLTKSLDTEFPQPRKFGSYIGQVPKEYREGNEHQYTPTTVSIGPLHASSPRLLGGQEIKLQYLNSFKSRLSEGKDLGFLLKLMERNREAVSSHYDPGTFERNSYDIEQMMVLDGCFIIELILSRYLEEDSYEDQIADLILGRTGIVSSLRRDILLLENQLPYFVLELLYDQTSPDRRVKRWTLSHLVRKFIEPLLPVPDPPVDIHNLERPANHLLELAWTYIIPSHDTTEHSLAQKQGKIASYDFVLFRLLHGKSASELVAYGVKYGCEFPITCLTHASFKSGLLRLPFMHYRESTKSLFWNLLAFEQLVDSKRKYNYFQSYVLFMNRLIKTEEDVRILAREYCAIHLRVRELSEIVSLFDSLARKINYDDITNFCYADVLLEVDRYCETGFRRVRAYLVRLFTNSRWDPVSAILLFILTAVQTFYTVASYGHGKN